MPTSHYINIAYHIISLNTRTPQALSDTGEQIAQTTSSDVDTKTFIYFNCVTCMSEIVRIIR